MTVWVLPLPLLPEDVDEGGMSMLDGLPNCATHSVSRRQINHVKAGTERNSRCTQLS